MRQNFNAKIVVDGKNYKDEIFTCERTHEDLIRSIMLSWLSIGEQFYNYLYKVAKKGPNQAFKDAYNFDFPITIDCSYMFKDGEFTAKSLLIFPQSEEMNMVCDEYDLVSHVTKSQMNAFVLHMKSLIKLREAGLQDGNWFDDDFQCEMLPPNYDYWIAGFPPALCNSQTCQRIRNDIHKGKTRSLLN